MENKFAIIGGDIHQLVKIKKNEDFSIYAWRIHETDDLYWIPVKDHKINNESERWWCIPNDSKECPTCLKTWYSAASKNCIG